MPTPQALDQNLANLRKQKGLTLDALAEQSGVSRATISALENGSGNPRIDTIWNLANALGVEFGELVSGGSDTEVTDGNGITVRLIDRQTSPQKIETYMMDLPAGARRDASAHPAGVTENIVVLTGTLAVGTFTEELQIAAGQSHMLAADIPHFYAAKEQLSRSIVTVIYPKQYELSAGTDSEINWPANKEEWDALNKYLWRISDAVQNGCNYARIRFKGLPKPNCRDKLKNSWNQEFDTRSIPKPLQVYFSSQLQPELLLFYRTPPMHPLPENPELDTPLIESCRRLAKDMLLDAAILEYDKVRQIIRDTKSFVEAALANDLLTHIEHSVAFRKKRGDAKSADYSQILKNLTRPAEYLFERMCSPYWTLRPGLARQMLAVSEALPIMKKSQNEVLCVDSDDSKSSPGLLAELRPELKFTLLTKGQESGEEEIWEMWEKGAEDSHTITFEGYKPTHLFHAVVVMGAPDNTDICTFLLQLSSWLKKGGSLMWTDEMLSPFSNESEYALALIKHRTWLMLDKLFRLPEETSFHENRTAKLLKEELPRIMYLAMSEDAKAVIGQVEDIYKKVKEFEWKIPWRTIDFPDPNGFEIEEMKKLAEELENSLCNHTYAERFVTLAESCGFQLKQHERIYATDGDREWDAGTHLFVLEKQ